MTLIDLFREFGSVSTLENYTSSSRILYHTLLWCWNEQRRKEITTVPTARLYTLAGLPESTFRDAFSYLADRGWVKRVKSRNRGNFAWIMRDRRESTAPLAAVPMSRAQSKENRREDSANEAESSPRVAQSTEPTVEPVKNIVSPDRMKELFANSKLFKRLSQ